jgi:hypothetical protein
VVKSTRVLALNDAGLEACLSREFITWAFEPAIACNGRFIAGKATIAFIGDM